ncbi:MAG TPA: LysR family transcriptional regulator [Magnetovibrio sp.]
MIHATLQQLRLFDAVARHKSITQAVEEVHLTQPAVSIQVKRLEEKVGMPLIEHIGKKLHLTNAGEEVFRACHDVMQRLGSLETALDDLRGEVSGALNVTVVSSAKYFMPQMLGSFVRRYPKVEPRLQITNRAKLLSRLSGNEDDLYVTGRVPDDIDVVDYPFLENVLVVVARPDHPLVGEQNITLERLARERIIGRESGSGTRKAIEGMFEKEGLKVSPYIELDSTEAIKQGVIGGLGIAILSLHSLRLELEANALAVLEVKGFPLYRQWYAVHRKGKRLSNAARAFLEYLEQEGENELAHFLKGSEAQKFDRLKRG